MPAEDSEPATRADFKELKTDINAVESRLKSDIKALKSELKTDINAVESTLKSDIETIKTDIKALEATTNRIAKDQVKMGGELRGMEERFVERLSDFKSELLQAFEESVVKGKRYDDKALTHGDQLQNHEARLGNHEKRILALEPPRTG